MPPNFPTLVTNAGQDMSSTFSGTFCERNSGCGPVLALRGARVVGKTLKTPQKSKISSLPQIS